MCRISQALFGGDVLELTEADLEQLALDGMPSSTSQSGVGLLTAMVEAELAKSTGEARKLVQGGGVRINGEQISDPTVELDFEQGFYGRFLLVKRGKKAHHLLVKENIQ